MRTVFYVAPTCFGAIIFPSTGSWQHYLLLYVLKKSWCTVIEDAEIIALYHVGDMLKIVNINYSIVHLLMLHELFTM